MLLMLLILVVVPAHSNCRITLWHSQHSTDIAVSPSIKKGNSQSSRLWDSKTIVLLRPKCFQIMDFHQFPNIGTSSVRISSSCYLLLHRGTTPPKLYRDFLCQFLVRHKRLSNVREIRGCTDHLSSVSDGRFYS